MNNKKCSTERNHLIIQLIVSISSTSFGIPIIIHYTIFWNNNFLFVSIWFQQIFQYKFLILDSTLFTLMENNAQSVFFLDRDIVLQKSACNEVPENPFV